MKHTKLFLFGVLIIGLLTNAFTMTTSSDLKNTLSPEPSKLVVVWTSGDREVALKMVFMYTYNSKKYAWWDKVRLIVWGPSSKLLSEDKELQDYLSKMKEGGVELLACKACADMYGVSDKLKELGIEVKYIGKDLSEMLQAGWTCLTF